MEAKQDEGIDPHFSDVIYGPHDDNPHASADGREPHECDGKVMAPSLLNPALLHAENAVRGPLYLHAKQLERSGRSISYLNVGNPQAVGQRPLTWVRQVLGLCINPSLLDDPQAQLLFPVDARARARQLLLAFPGGVGCYSDSRGSPTVRREVAGFITRREGGGSEPCSPDSVMLFDGASSAIRSVITALIRGPTDGILMPTPQYPIYRACTILAGGRPVPYELIETRGWALDTNELDRAMVEARGQGIDVRALVVITPNNPTGAMLDRTNLDAIISFAASRRVIILADEVYQDTIFDAAPFTSLRRALLESTTPGVELVSFHSCSKGAMGECGLRGGYAQFENLSPGTIDQLYKLSSISLAPNSIGQAAVSLLVNGPPPGGPSIALYEREKAAIMTSLGVRARMVEKVFGAVKGMRLHPAQGAMYAFPSIEIPPWAVAEAARQGKAADELYCLDLLEKTGICVVPGSGFGQSPGTFHFRITILTPETELLELLHKIARFHEYFTNASRTTAGA